MPAKLPAVTAGPSTLRRQRRLALLVLSALLLRALIPSGFMPLAGPGGPHLGFCPGAGVLPPGPDDHPARAAHIGHVHHGGRGAPEPPHHPMCLFSAGATTVFAAVPAPATTVPMALAPGEQPASLIVLPAILRAQAPRGPPRTV